MAGDRIAHRPVVGATDFVHVGLLAFEQNQSEIAGRAAVEGFVDQVFPFRSLLDFGIFLEVDHEEVGRGGLILVFELAAEELRRLDEQVDESEGAVTIGAQPFGEHAVFGKRAGVVVVSEDAKHGGRGVDT